MTDTQRVRFEVSFDDDEDEPAPPVSLLAFRWVPWPFNSTSTRVSAQQATTPEQVRPRNKLGLSPNAEDLAKEMSEAARHLSGCGYIDTMYYEPLQRCGMPIPRRRILRKSFFEGFDPSRHESMVSYTETAEHESARKSATETGFSGSIHGSGWGLSLSVSASTENHTNASLNSSSQSSSMVSTHAVEVTALRSDPPEVLQLAFDKIRDKLFFVPESSSEETNASKMLLNLETARLENFEKVSLETVLTESEKNKIGSLFNNQFKKDCTTQDGAATTSPAAPATTPPAGTAGTTPVGTAATPPAGTSNPSVLNNRDVLLFLARYGTHFASRHWGGVELNKISAFSSGNKTHRELATATLIKASADASGGFCGVEAGVSASAQDQSSSTTSDTQSETKITVTSTLTASGFIPGVLGNAKEWEENLSMCTFVRLDRSTVLPIEAIVAIYNVPFAKQIVAWKKAIIQATYNGCQDPTDSPPVGVPESVYAKEWKGSAQIHESLQFHCSGPYQKILVIAKGSVNHPLPDGENVAVVEIGFDIKFILDGKLLKVMKVSGFLQERAAMHVPLIGMQTFTEFPKGRILVSIEPQNAADQIDINDYFAVSVILSG